MNSLNFWSGKNYMKRDTSSGSTFIAAPATLAFGGNVYITQYTVAHNLGYVPFFKVFYEPFKDGVIWEPLASRNQGAAYNPRNTSTTAPYLLAWATTASLVIELGYTSNSLSGTYPIYWVIYKDYGIA